MLHAVLAAVMLLTQPANQFDLVCAETVTSGGDYLETTTKPSTIRIRVDLQRKLWCAAECESPQEIARINEVELTLQNYDGEHLSTRRTVNRTTGAYSLTILGSVQGISGFTRSTGQCERAAFSGMPQTRF